MEQKINIAELLKDCPKCMELDCLMYEDVYFDYIDEFNIIHCYIQHKTHKASLTFTQHGTHHNDIKAKCVIFPKGKTTWEGFVPPCKFKNGDVIQVKDGYKVKITEVNVDDECYGYESMIAKGIGGIAFSDQDDWELAPNIKPKFKIGDRVKDKNNFVYTILSVESWGYMLNDLHRTCIGLDKQDNYELFLDKFDITTLKPFDKVLVRVCDTAKWIGDFYMWHDDAEKDFPYNCVGGIWSQCIPYEGNQHLLGTTNDCDDYYKIWE